MNCDVRSEVFLQAVLQIFYRGWYLAQRIPGPSSLPSTANAEQALN
jgi:hypothetical protein